VQRLAAQRRHVTRRDEEESFRDRYLTLQPSLDESSWRLSGRLPGVEDKIVEKALERRGDEQPDLAMGVRPAYSQRNADALASIAQDSLTGTPDAPLSDPLVTIFVDGDRAATSSAELGAEITAGPRVGPATLERLMCEGRAQVIHIEEGRPVAASPGVRTIPTAIRRFVLWRDAGCVIDGCSSRYRLQPHHRTPWAQGGSHDPNGLATLCWYHHHIAIHGSGFTIDPQSPPHRLRLRPPETGPDPPRTGP